jgi:hypothetical protein
LISQTKQIVQPTIVLAIYMDSPIRTKLSLLCWITDIALPADIYEPLL